MPRRYWNQLLHGAKARGIEVHLTIEEAWAVFVAQSGRCALSGLSLSFASSSRTTVDTQTASLDRKRSDLPYTADNVQWVHKRVQLMKGRLTDEEFIEWCCVVAEFANDTARKVG